MELVEPTGNTHPGNRGVAIDVVINSCSARRARHFGFATLQSAAFPETCSDMPCVDDRFVNPDMPAEFELGNTLRACHDASTLKWFAGSLPRSWHFEATFGHS